MTGTTQNTLIAKQNKYITRLSSDQNTCLSHSYAKCCKTSVSQQTTQHQRSIFWLVH